MPSAVRLRTDFSAREVRRLAKQSRDNNENRRLLSRHMPALRPCSCIPMRSPAMSPMAPPAVLSAKKPGIPPGPHNLIKALKYEVPAKPLISLETIFCLFSCPPEPQKIAFSERKHEVDRRQVGSLSIRPTSKFQCQVLQGSITLPAPTRSISCSLDRTATSMHFRYRHVHWSRGRCWDHSPAPASRGCGFSGCQMSTEMPSSTHRTGSSFSARVTGWSSLWSIRNFHLTYHGSPCLRASRRFSRT